MSLPVDDAGAPAWQGWAIDLDRAIFRWHWRGPLTVLRQRSYASTVIWRAKCGQALAADGSLGMNTVVTPTGAGVPGMC